MNITALNNIMEDNGKAKTRIFRFRQDIFKLQEFNLSGLQVRESVYRSEFDDLQVLTVGTTSPTYLLTPEAARYMESFIVKKITETH